MKRLVMAMVILVLVPSAAGQTATASLRVHQSSDGVIVLLAGSDRMTELKELQFWVPEGARDEVATLANNVHAIESHNLTDIATRGETLDGQTLWTLDFRRFANEGDNGTGQWVFSFLLAQADAYTFREPVGFARQLYVQPMRGHDARLAGGPGHLVAHDFTDKADVFTTPPGMPLQLDQGDEATVSFPTERPEPSGAVGAAVVGLPLGFVAGLLLSAIVRRRRKDSVK